MDVFLRNVCARRSCLNLDHLSQRHPNTVICCKQTEVQRAKNNFVSHFQLLVISASISLLLIQCGNLNRVVAQAGPDLPLPESDTDILNDVTPCEACQLLVKSFEKGVEATSRGKHEGGDTSWEERKLKNYADSEVRLVEIQENLCEDVKGKGKAQCLSLAEDTEPDVEEWWFKQRNKNVRLHDYLCISKLKLCCPGGKFGPNCQPCTSNCNDHGACDGDGTRLGTGKCTCDPGYLGEVCEECDGDHFRIATSNHFTCRKCDTACKSCFGPGPTNCTECRAGYHKHDVNGCIDINECETGQDASGNTRLCRGNTYCINTDGSYRCADCHVSCAGCVGYGPSRCIACARGYKVDDDYVCRSREEFEKMESIEREELVRQGRGTMARYFFYAGVLAVSAMMFRSNLYVMYTFTLGFIVVLLLSELNLLSTTVQEDYSMISSE